ncbi:MAG: 16S rRNA (cytosine(1402)-N(4))-methyltransferase RsmH [Patescibacteria group bacterium]
MSRFHDSVLKDEAIDLLNVVPGKKYIDATAGGGGHTEEMVKRGGIVLAIDRDQEAAEVLRKKNFKGVVVVKDNFSRISELAQKYDFEKVSGILFDLGVSSHQLDDPKRGFSFQKEGPLDMRMDADSNIKATDIINNFEKRRLNEIFQTYGQEKFSLAIADAICSARQIRPFITTLDLANIVSEVYRKKRMRTKLHPATKVFQALRIVINSELLNLEEALAQTEPLLETNGRLVIISFHSLEDAIVKRFLKESNCLKPLSRLPIGPGAEEVQKNPRSRSAKMRAAVKIIN